MEFLSYFNNVLFFNICFFLIATHLMCVICYGVFVASDTKLAYPALLNSFNGFSLFFLSCTLWLFCYDFASFDQQYFYNQSFQLFFTFIACCVLFCSRDFFISRSIVKFEYDILFLFFMLSAIGLCFSDDFLIFYLAIELQSLVLYIFATFNRNSEFSTEAGLKYFVFGGIISCFLLFGITLIYLVFGSTNFEILFSFAATNNDPFWFCGILFVMVALFFKIGAAPFHSWLCDVYDGSILSVTMLFSSAPKIILYSFIVKLFFFVFYDFAIIWSDLFLYASLLSISVGSLSALYQKRVKRLFAYSTIAHTGFILLGVLCCSIESIKAMVVYIVIYSIVTVLTFSFLINSGVSNPNYPKYLANWTAVGVKNYVFAISFSIVVFSMAGIPPLAGFFSKFFVLLNTVGQGYYFLAFVIIMISSAACFYYIRLIKIFFFVKNTKNSFWLSNASKTNTEIIIAPLFFFNMFFFCYPDILSNFANVVGFIVL
jgi:NADH-quinone oxidoreductase subunit N